MLFETPVTDVSATSGAAILASLPRATLSDILDLLVRESIQNAYDARISDSITPKYEFRAYDLKRDSKTQIIRNIDRGSKGKDTNRFITDLSNSNHVIEIADRNTTGLVGPYWQKDRAGNIIDAEAKNYLGLVFATGQIKSKNGGAGGTTGIGKACYYIASKVHTVGFYTKIKIEENGRFREETRFIISRLNREKEIPSRFYYAGKNNPILDPKDWIPKPLLNREADAMASYFGLKPFKSGEYGTSIMILEPDFRSGTKNIYEYLRTEIKALVTYWFWPLILKQAIDISFEIDGKLIDFKNGLDSNPVIDQYSELFLNWNLNIPNAWHSEVRTPKVKEPIGYIYKAEFAVDVHQIPAKFRKNNCFIAPMRNIDFIMRYDEFNSNAIPPGHMVVAFFHCARENVILPSTGKSIDEILRISEDPPHQNWLITSPSLDNADEQEVVRCVNHAISDFKNDMSKYETPVDLKSVSTRVSDRLSRFMQFGFAPSKPLPEAKTKKRGKKKRVLVPQKQAATSKKKFRRLEGKDPIIIYASNSPARTIIIPYERQTKGSEKIMMRVRALLEGSQTPENQSKVVRPIKVSWSETYTENTNEWNRVDMDNENKFIADKPGYYYIHIRAAEPVEFDLTFKIV